MAAAAQPPPGLFTFFKHGALLPARNRGLFLPILALTAALPLVTSRLALSLVDSRFEAAVALVDCNANVHAELGPPPRAELRPPPLTAYAFVVAVTFVNGVIKITTVSAAVASYTGERHTLVSILGKVQSNLWSPLDTLIVFGFVLKWAAQAAQVPLKFLAYIFSFTQQPALDAFLELASVPVKAICDVAVVVSVAEPGLHGPRAAARAWRLMEGKKAQAALYATAVWTLSLLYKLVGWWWRPRSVARELPAVGVSLVLLRWADEVPAVGVAFVLLRWADEVFFVAVVTAYYFECKQVQEERGADLEQR